MQILRNADLQPRHSLASPALARELVLLESLDEWRTAGKGDIVLSSGSNVIFCGEIQPRLLHPVMKGRQVVGETREYVYLQVQAGENWHETVEFIVKNNWFGAENLALIPGSVGAAPVQNIGAYGVEFSDIVASVQVYDWRAGTFQNINAKNCGFAYRFSHFKGQWRGRYFITAVTLKLKKNAALNLDYAGLREQAQHLTSPSAVMWAVVNLRQFKLPDPNQEPNVGSFFHNPIIERAHFATLKMRFPDIPCFPHGKKVKIPAAWCIEKCGFKGAQVGAVGISAQHALVLVNHGGTGAEILAFAREIQRAVWNRFAVSLQIEPTIIGEVK